MHPIVQVCIVIASVAMVVTAVAAVRTMRCIERASNQLSLMTVEFTRWLGQAQELTREARETVMAIRGTLAPIRRVVDRFETLGQRTASLTDAVIGEVEEPLRAAVAVARGMKSFTAAFMNRMTHRFAHGRAATNGGVNYE